MEQNKLHIDELLLLQFLTGETTAEQTQEIAEWLHAKPENQKWLDQLEAVWAETGKLTPSPVAVDIEKAWSSMNLKLEMNGQNKHTHEKKPVKRLFYLSAIAAMLILALGIFRLITGPFILAETQLLASNNEKIKTSLPDGSVVTLNTNSTIYFPDRFSKNERKVHIKGEAYFKITPDAQKPFIIDAGKASIQVLGTSFTVKAYKNNPMEVKVASGVVKFFTVDSVSGDTTAIKLTAGKKGTLAENSSVPEVSLEPLDPDELFWVDQTLLFNQTPLKQVIFVLEKQYGKTIEVNNPAVLDCRYSATFQNSTLDDVLQALASSFAFELSQSNGTYLLNGNGCLQE